MKPTTACRNIVSLACAFTLVLASAGNSHAVGTRRFKLDRGKDFRGGDLQGVAIDSSGQVKAGLNLGKLVLPDSQSIWCTLLRPDGSLLLGTGNEGKLIEVRDGAVHVLAETGQLVISTLTEAWNGDVLVGTLPGGKVLRLKDGKLTEFAKLKGTEHIWQLAYNATEKVVYAATGPEGKLFRIDASGKAEVYFKAEEEHLISLAVANTRGKPTVYVGTGSRAKLYQVRGPGRASVLHDFNRTEVRAIVTASNGDIYAVANDIKGRTSSSSRASSSSSSSSKTTGKGVLYRFSPQGVPEKLLTNNSEFFISLALDSNGQPYVGTGIKGRVYSVDSTHNDTLMADTEERQVSALSLSGKRRYIATSDPAVLHTIRGVGGTNAIWTSKPLDAGLRAQFGRLGWTSSAPLKLSTRSGNTKQPDDTWSPWTTGVTEPETVKSPAARYVQIRARWNRNPAATLSDVTLPFLTDNLRAVLTEVRADGQPDEGDSRGDDGISASGGPVTDEADSVVTLKWRVDNPDEDELRYRLSYQMLGETRWTNLLPPRESLTKKQYDWDTADLPEGRYRVRVEASDELSNPPTRVKRHERTSGVVVVDNTPPALVSLRHKGTQISGVAVDGVGPIARIEMSIAGSDEWLPFFPQDGIFDQQRERFDVNLQGLVPANGALISIRVYDRANNFVVRHVTVPHSSLTD